MIPWHLWYRFYYCGHFTDEETERQRGWVICSNMRLIHSVRLKTVEVAHAKHSHGAWVAVRPQNGSCHFLRANNRDGWEETIINKPRTNKECKVLFHWFCGRPCGRSCQETVPLDCCCCVWCSNCGVWEWYLFIHTPQDEQLRVLGIEFMVLETILTFFDLSSDMIINKLVCVFLKKNSYFWSLACRMLKKMLNSTPREHKF